MKSRFMATGIFMAFVSAWLPSQAKNENGKDRQLPFRYVISNNDSINVYNAFMYSSLHEERLKYTEREETSTYDTFQSILR